MNRTCTSCYYYHKERCCIGPPKMDKFRRAFWPKVEDDQWCGKHKKREQTEPE